MSDPFPADISSYSIDLSDTFKSRESRSHGISNIEASSITAHVACFMPSEVALQLIGKIEAPTFY